MGWNGMGQDEKGQYRVEEALYIYQHGTRNELAMVYFIHTTVGLSLWLGS